LSIAISLIAYPSIVYLDEPSAGVDPASRRFLVLFFSFLFFSLFIYLFFLKFFIDFFIFYIKIDKKRSETKITNRKKGSDRLA